MLTPHRRHSFEAPSLTAMLSGDHKEIDHLFTIAQTSLDSGRWDAACTALDRIWMRLAVHIRAEHKVIFPVLEQTHPDLRRPLQTLHEDHDAFMTVLAGAVKALRDPSPEIASIQAAIEALKLRLTAHNALEEASIYPAADRLPPDQVTAMLEEAARELNFLPSRYGS
ncbi:hypothetical protein GETHLI_31270 [Geothrix limicola]|uniref:Hemerythrin-like domain-containing protein n=1 Tax=Geothrix limicola TaxID=2927978 RepID=A0ABQ5QJT0_9BACT|nr:hemerythrin domain-containing protein [Geothrix limicola]GLH74625.1 hypothetical protein GETHLI_31270 [Geothrix limicola]